MTIYFIQLKDQTGPVKIGYATNVNGRFVTLQTAHHETLSIIRLLPGGRSIEYWLQDYYKDLHIAREWFHFSDSMLTIQPPTVVVSKKDDMIKCYRTILNFSKVARQFNCTKEYIRRIVVEYEIRTGDYLGRRSKST